MNTPKPNTKTSSPLSFTGTSTDGDLTEALKDALKKAAEAAPEVPWKIEEIRGNRFKLGLIAVTIQLNPDASEGVPGKDPKIPLPPPPPPPL
ncbi:MAG TPA: hypothetical protein VGK91_09400 [Candidatus Udaeobacter sp.]|jgi:hypothetical protein